MAWERANLARASYILFVEVAKTLECKGSAISLMDENTKLLEHAGRSILKEESERERE